MAESGFLQKLPNIGSVEHMDAAWLWLHDQLQSRHMGTDSKGSRWFAWEQASRYASQRRVQDLVILLYLGFKRGWWKRISECPLECRAAAIVDPGDAELPGEVAEVGGSAMDAEGAQGEGDAAGVSASRTSIGEARKAVCDARKQCANTLQYCANVLAQESKCRLWAGMASLPQPVERWFMDVVSALKSPAGCETLVHDLSKGSLDGAVLDVLRHVCSGEFASVVGVGTAPIAERTPHLLRQDKMVMNTMWQYAVNMCGELMITSSGFAAPPYCFVGLLKGGERQAAVLAKLRDSWSALLELEQTAHVDSGCRAFLGSLVVTKMQFIRELLVKLMETNFSEVSGEVQVAIQEFARSFQSSLICEEMFNIARRVSGCSRTNKMEFESIYHCASVGKDLLSDFGRQQVVVDQSARAASIDKVPRSVFGFEGIEPTLEPGDLDHLGSSRPDWPAVGPQSLKHQGLAWALISESGGKWARISSAWLSLLMTPGTAVMHKDHKVTLLVLGVSQYGFRAWRSHVQQQGRCMTFAPDPGAASRFHWVSDPSDWRVVQCDLDVVEDGMSAGPAAIAPKLLARGSTLLKHACLQGFPRLTVPLLRRLFYKVLNVTGDPPARLATEASLVAALSRHILDSPTEAAIAEVMQRRHKGDTPQDLPVDDALTVDMLAVLENDIADDDAGIRAQIEKLREVALRQAAARQQKVEEVNKAAHAMAAQAASSGSGSSGVGAPPVGPRPRRFVPVPTSGPTAEEARVWLPEGFRVSKDSQRENRWRVRGPSLVGERSKSFGRGSSLTEWEALAFLLEVAWRSHSQATGEQCPWSFEGLTL